MLEWGFLGWNSGFEILLQERRKTSQTKPGMLLQRRSCCQPWLPPEMLLLSFPGWVCLRLLPLSLISDTAQHYLARNHHLLFHSCHNLSLGRSTDAVLFQVVVHNSFCQIALDLCTRINCNTAGRKSQTKSTTTCTTAFINQQEENQHWSATFEGVTGGQVAECQCHLTKKLKTNRKVYFM